VGAEYWFGDRNRRDGQYFHWDKDEQKLKRHSAQVQEMQEAEDFAWTPELAWQHRYKL